MLSYVRSSVINGCRSAPRRRVRQLSFAGSAALAVDVLWSNASGSVLIGVIPGSGHGRVGVISGNQFTPLPWPAAAAFKSGTC